MKRWAIINASRVIVGDRDGKGKPFTKGDKLDILEKGTIIGEGNKILQVTENKKPKELKEIYPRNIIDAQNRLVSPGLIDSHTHSVFYGTRENEYNLRIKGASYAEIARAGGGILNTTAKVRQLTKNELYRYSLPYISSFVQNGTTTFECKSGYGLSTSSELKLLRVIQNLQQEKIIDIVPTFLGAHEIPAEYRADGELGDKNDYIQLIKNKMLPAVSANKLAVYNDVFCEKGVFTAEETRDILLEGRKRGLEPRFHADEIVSTGGAELAAEINAKSADHLGAISKKGISCLADSKTVATMLPGTVLFLNLSNYAPARQLIDSGAIVALASDFNPGSCPTNNLSLMMTLAASRMRMTIEECWASVTINAAYSLDMSTYKGSLAKGFDADIVIWNTDNENMIPYSFGRNLVQTVIKGGKIAYNA